MSKIFCKTCSQNLCSLCYDEHDDGHDILDLKYYLSNKGNHCFQHKEKLSLYCTTCKTSICKLCYESKHLKHTTINICDYIVTTKKELSSVRMPYNIKTIDTFIEKFSEEESLFLKKMKNAIHIFL